MRRILILVAALIAPLSAAHAQKLDDTPRTVLMTAYYPEWNALEPSIDDPRKHQINGMTFLTGTMAGKPVLLMQSGVSMVNAAMNTQLALDHFAVKRIVFSGIAGGVDPALNIGDVIVADSWGQYLEVSFARRTKKGYEPPEKIDPEAPLNWNFMFPRGVRVGSATQAPSRHYVFHVDPALLTLARQVVPQVEMERCVPPSEKALPGSELCLPKTPKVVVGGTGVSAGVFADNAAFRIYLQKAWNARLLDMESAAVLQVAYANSVPAIAFRSLSDLAGGDRHKNMEDTFEHLASVNSAHVVRAFVAALPD